MKQNLHPELAAAGTALLFFLLPMSAAHGEQVALAQELERLSSNHGFTVKGIDKIAEAQGRADRDELLPRLRRLLEKFDHVILEAPDGGVERVIILGEKVHYEPPPPPPPSEPRTAEADEERGSGDADSDEDETSGEIVLQTSRRGTQHAVKASLEGSGGNRINQSLLVDTGADNLVLPLSLATRLGLTDKDLAEREMQTANGTVSARFGKVSALWLGKTRIADVEVAFLEDGKLGNSGLLGMNVLGRYKMTIDDESNRLTLTKK